MEAEIDTLDAVLAPLFTVGAISSTGLGSLTLLGTDLSTQAISLGASGLSYGALLSVVVLGVAAVSNQTLQTLSDGRGRSNSFRLQDLKPAESIALVGTAGIIVLNTVSPGFNEFLTSSDVTAMLALVVEAAGYYVVSYSS